MSSDLAARFNLGKIFQKPLYVWYYGTMLYRHDILISYV